MGNYRQHVAFASSLGGAYAVAGYFLAGLYWVGYAFLVDAKTNFFPSRESIGKLSNRAP